MNFSDFCKQMLPLTRGQLSILEWIEGRGKRRTYELWRSEAIQLMKRELGTQRHLWFGDWNKVHREEP